MKKFGLICFVLLSIYSCSKDEGREVKDKVLTGTVEGKAFTFKGGKAFITIFNNQEKVSVNLTNVAADCSSNVFDFELEIRTIVPREIGVFTTINIATQDGNNTPFNHLNQTVEITALSDTQISGKMKLYKKESSLAGESIFEGTFTIPLCLQDD